MSYGYGLGSGQGGAKAKPVHKLISSRSCARFCAGKGRFEKYYCEMPGLALMRWANPDSRNAVDTRRLDAIDLRILSELQANGRITNVELSRRAKITAPPCLRRMRALEKTGFIQGYHADLDARALGFEVTCVATDLSSFQRFVTETLTAEKNVASVKSSLVIHSSKSEAGVPLDV